MIIETTINTITIKNARSLIASPHPARQASTPGGVITADTLMAPPRSQPAGDGASSTPNI